MHFKNTHILGDSKPPMSMSLSSIQSANSTFSVKAIIAMMPRVLVVCSSCSKRTKSANFWSTFSTDFMFTSYVFVFNMTLKVKYKLQCMQACVESTYFKLKASRSHMATVYNYSIDQGRNLLSKFVQQRVMEIYNFLSQLIGA